MSFCFRDKTYDLDEHGFLFPTEQWDEAFAAGMAIKVGVLDGLSDRHWQLIHYQLTTHEGAFEIPRRPALRG